MDSATSETMPPSTAPPISASRAQSPFAWAALVMTFISFASAALIVRKIHGNPKANFGNFERFAVANGMALWLLGLVCAVIGLFELRRRKSLAIIVIVLDLALSALWLGVMRHG